MELSHHHELHRRRRSRNIGLGAVLVLFVVLIFGMTVVKLRQGELMEAYDHTLRTTVLPIEPAPAAEVTQ